MSEMEKIIHLEAQCELLKAQLQEKEEKYGEEKEKRIRAEEKLKENELLEIMPIRSIRKKIEVNESLVEPELHDPVTVFNHLELDKWKTTNQQFDYHEANWLVILSQTTNGRVSKLLSLIAAAGINPRDFCRTIGGFFIVCSGAIQVPPLTSYSVKQMKNFLRNSFSIQDNDVKIKCVTEILMKFV